jgi:hypothetical protein
MDLEADVSCAFCGRTEPMEHAIADGWIPSFWADAKPYGPACSECAAEHLMNPDDDEPTIKPGHVVPSR